MPGGVGVPSNSISVPLHTTRWARVPAGETAVGKTRVGPAFQDIEAVREAGKGTKTNIESWKCRNPRAGKAFLRWTLEVLSKQKQARPCEKKPKHHQQQPPSSGVVYVVSRVCKQPGPDLGIWGLLSPQTQSLYQPAIELGATGFNRDGAANSGDHSPRKDCHSGL